MGKLGLFQVTRGEALYFTGEMDGFYFGTTTDFSAAVDVYAYDAGEGKLNLRIGEDGQYIAAKKSDDGEHENIVMQADPFAWGYDEAHDAYVATLSDGDYYIGNYSNYDTLSLSATTSPTSSRRRFPPLRWRQSRFPAASPLPSEARSLSRPRRTSERSSSTLSGLLPIRMSPRSRMVSSPA